MDPFIGQIQPFGFNFAPRSWARCDGNLLSISQNTALFSLLGTFYGGDGRTTFALPNLQGRVMLHQGTGPGLPTFRIGEMGGVEQHTLTAAQIPPHAHSVSMPVSNGAADSDAAAGHFLTNQSREVYAGAATANEHYGADGITTGSTGGNQPSPSMAPYLVVNVCIALQGVYPSRS